MNDLHAFLKKMGLNDKEGKIYLALVEIGTQAASIVAKKADLPRSSTFFHLDRLIKKGFAEKVTRGKVQYFSAIPPSELEQILGMKKNKIETHLTELQGLLPIFGSLKSPLLEKSRVSHFEGVEGICKMIDLVTHQDVPLYYISAHEFHPEVYSYIRNVYVPRRSEMKSKSQMIVVKSPQSINYSDYAKDVYDWIGFIDTKDVTFESTIAIYGNKIHFISNTSEDLTGIVVENASLAKTMKSVFELIKLSAFIKGN